MAGGPRGLKQAARKSLAWKFSRRSSPWTMVGSRCPEGGCGGGWWIGAGFFPPTPSIHVKGPSNNFPALLFSLCGVWSCCVLAKSVLEGLLILIAIDCSYRIPIYL